jgi:CDP-diacylglycerol--glycerol-3-phosphate 3-phosphatidyltransferase
MPIKLKFPQRVDIALYRTPDMGRLLGRIAPSRWNETIGVQHTKVALFDNQLILTG